MVHVPRLDLASPKRRKRVTRRWPPDGLRLPRPQRTARAAPHYPVVAEGSKWSQRLPPLSVRDNASKDADKYAFCDFEGWGVDDIYIMRMCGSHSFAGCTCVNLQNNRLEGPCLAMLATHLPDTICSLNLSHNRLTTVSALVSMKLPHLTDLNLSGNPLGDSVVGLLNVLESYPALHALGLASCRIGSEATARACALYLAQPTKLVNVDLHWNRFSSFTGYIVVAGLYDRISRPEPSLRRVNLAHNALGSGQHIAPERKNTKQLNRCLFESMRCAKMIAQLFAEDKTLFHFDLSYNNFSSLECQAIGDGLRENKTLFGLHLLGNAGDVDPEGFLRHHTNGTGRLQDMPTRMLDLLIPLKFKTHFRCPPACCVPKNGHMEWLEHRKHVSLPQCFNTHDVTTQSLDCWICDNWLAYTISFVPTADDDVPADADVHAYLSIDRYEVAVLLHSDAKNPRKRKCVRMVPPSSGPIIVFFKCKEQFLISGEMKSMSAAGLDLPPFASSFSEVNFFRADRLARELSVKGRMWELRFCEGPPGKPKVVPRCTVENAAAENVEWSYATSVFKDFARDDAGLAEASQADWRYSKLQRVVQEPEHFREFIRPHYAHIMNIWRRTSCHCTSPVFVVKLPSLVKFFESCDADLFDASFGADDLEAIFATMLDEEDQGESHVLSEKGPNPNPEEAKDRDGLVRVQFLECLVRIAAARWPSLHGGTRLNEGTGGVRKLLDVILDEGTRLTEDRSRFHTMLFTAECHFVITEYEDSLRSIFDKYAAIMPASGKEGVAGISFYAWKEFLNDVGAFDEEFTKRDAAVPFVFYSKQLVEDQLTELSWAEFIVAVAATIRLREGFEESLFADQLEEFLQEDVHMLSMNTRQGLDKTGRVEMDAQTRQFVAFLCRIFDEADDDNSGTLSFGEFRRWFFTDRVKKELGSVDIKPTEIKLLFKQMDRSMDSELTVDEVISTFLDLRQRSNKLRRIIAVLEQVFEEGDEDNSGSMSKDEFTKLFSKREIVLKFERLGVDVEDLAELFGKIDADGSGEVTVEELVYSFLSICNPARAANKTMTVLKQIMRERDADGSGTLSLPELRGLLSDSRLIKKLARFNIEIPPALEWFNTMDTDNNGELSWVEISSFMEQQINAQKPSTPTQLTPTTPRGARSTVVRPSARRTVAGRGRVTLAP